MAPEKAPDAITAVTLKGFKSFADDTRIEIRPLTLLAGANSSGKSSAMQPLLLMKQTEEASFDPGPLRLNGPNVQFTSASQILSLLPSRIRVREFEAGFEVGEAFAIRFRFSSTKGGGFELTSSTVRLARREIELRPGPIDPPSKDLAFLFARTRQMDADPHLPRGSVLLAREVVRRQGFLEVGALMGTRRKKVIRALPVTSPLRHDLGPLLRAVVHVPGLRGNPERSYGRTAADDLFPGTFESYVASLVASWQEKGDGRLNLLGTMLESLGLSWGVAARLRDATDIEILVGRLPRRYSKLNQLVNIADVGFGVSQVLPVLVALLAVEPGQLVYIEQPELHLHPRAQQALATILVDAAQRGVRIVAETHSSTLILAVQTLVAQGKLDPSIVKLHWFQRDARGATKVTSADLDEMGRYGDWPEDFAEVEADVEGGYLKAVEDKAFGKTGKRKRG